MKMGIYGVWSRSCNVYYSIVDLFRIRQIIQGTNVVMRV